MLKNSFNEDSNTTEVWKDIKGYEGRYQVSDMGRVKSLGRTIIYKTGRKRYQKERILKSKANNSGYLQVSLFSGSKGKTLLVHRLVCEAFHENPKNTPEVNHINEDKSDNRACNLEWVTAKENCNHGSRNAKIAKSVGQYTLDGKLIKIWQSAFEVQKYLGFLNSHINEVARGKRKTAYGYVWKYIG